jgi:hypothetical protein
MPNQEVFEKINDYTLSVTIDFERQEKADPELRRIFNFQAQQVTHIYSMWYSTGISTAMQIQRFSELDSLDEARLMREKLVAMGGRPPELPDPAMSKTSAKSLRL